MACDFPMGGIQGKNALVAYLPVAMQIKLMIILFFFHISERVQWFKVKTETMTISCNFTTRRFCCSVFLLLLFCVFSAYIQSGKKYQTEKKFVGIQHHIKWTQRNKLYAYTLEYSREKLIHLKAHAFLTVCFVLF